MNISRYNERLLADSALSPQSPAVKMTREEILQIIEIDRLNMSDFFSNSGKDFDVELRKSEIKEDRITYRCKGIELLAKLEKYIKCEF